MIMATWICFLITCVLAYCIGSISTGILVSRAMHGPDLRTVGSKNTGATNVQRTMGWKPGLITFFGDSLKAVLACWLGQLITGSHLGALAAGLFVVLGHNWPVFYRFKGGKGVASSCGVMLFCFPLQALICFAAGILIIALTHYVSLASMSLLTLYAVLVSLNWPAPGAGGDWRIIVWAVFLAVMCLARHHANIDRLIHGRENRISFGKKKDSAGK